VLPVRRVRVVVTGRVQGVFFRAECARRARALRLGGSVRNRADGAVEAEFVGTPAGVEAMIDWCRTGTELAQVDAVETTEEPPTDEHEFRVS
jgi:acylphosphatase